MAIECTYCEEKVNANRGIYIKCTKCQDIKLCLECFSAGATIAEHESDHPYELIDCGSFSIIDDSWKAFEELALLEAIELYGIGSWTDIGNAVETRSAEECSERYLRVYVDNFFGKSSWNAIERNQYTVHDHTCLHNQPLSPSLSLPEKHKIVDISREQQIRLGYMPKRDDFEREYDNEAELLVSKLAVNANDDTELDQDLKIAHINMYTDKLRERFRRKRIVLEYNLVKLFFHMHPEESSTSQGLLTTSNNLSIASQIKPPESNQSNVIDSSTGNPKSNKPLISDKSSLSHCTSNGKDSKLLPPSTSDSHQQSNSKLNNHHNNPSDITAQEKTSTNHNSVQNTILNYFRRIDPSTPIGSNKDSFDFHSNNTVANSTNTAFMSTSSNSSSTANNPQESSILSSYFSDLNKSIAEQDFNSMEKKLRIFCQFSSAEDHNRLIRNLAREKELKVKIKELIRKRKNGIKFHSNNSTSINGNEGGDIIAGNKQSPSTTKKTPTKSVSVLSSNREEPMEVDEIDDKSNTLAPTKVTQKKNNGNNNNHKNNNESTKAIMNHHLNQNSEPSWRLLSKKEKKLCKSSNLKASQYISYKTVIMKEHKQKKKKGAAQRLFTEDIDKTVKRRIVDFLTRNNWIKI